MLEALKIILVAGISACLAYFILVPFVTWCDKVKKEMQEDSHYDD